MRDSLTVLAILVIGVLTAALVGPYLIDWDSHRALIERKLSEAAGIPVTVTGPLDLKILPRPILRLGDVSVGGRGAGQPRITAAALDAELSLTALMRGQVQVVDTTLEKPQIDLVEASDGSFGFTLPADAAADRFAFDHVGVRDGALTLTLTDGRRVALTGLDLDGEAASLRGPIKITGRLGSDGTVFRLATGALDHGRMRIKLHVDDAGLRPDLDLDGTVASRPGPGSGLAFDGTGTAEGHLPLDGTTATVPWRLTAQVVADRDSASASGFELRAGTDMRALIADGDAVLRYAGASVPPTATVHLHGAALDVDRLAVAPEEGATAPPKGVAVLQLLLRLASDGARTVSLPLRLDVETGFDTATVGGQTLLGLGLKLGLGPEPTAQVGLSVDGPEGTHLGLDGRVEPGPAPVVAAPFGSAPAPAAGVFRGRVEARSNDIRRTGAWLASTAPGVAAWLATVAPGRRVAAKGEVEASLTGIAARDASLRLDGSAFTGALSFTRAVGPERARLFADLSSDVLDLDHLPDVSSAAAASRDLDLDLALTARAVTLANPSALGGTGLTPISAGHVAVRLIKAGDDLRLDRLSLDLGGAELDATASRSGSEAHADAHVSAPQLGPIADVLADLMPGSAATFLRGRAASLSPVDATLRIEASAPSGGGALVPNRVALSGTAGGTRFDAALTPDGPERDLGADARPLAVALRADAPEAADLMRQLGLPAVNGLGAAHLEGTARGSFAEGFAVNSHATLGATAFSYAGQASPARGGGRFTLRSADASRWLATLDLASSGNEAIPAEAAGDVAWAGATLACQHLVLRLGGTAAAGDLAFDLAAHRPGAGEPVVVRGSLSLDRLPADALLGLAWGSLPAPVGSVPWSTGAFKAAAASLPRGNIALKIDTLPLRGAFDARMVAMTLRIGSDAVSLADVTGKIEDGSIGGSLTLRRDGPGAALSGRLALNGVPFALGGLSGRVGGTQDLAGAGLSPAAVVASLAGTGNLILSGATLARTDPLAPVRAAAEADGRDAAAYRDGEMPDPAPPDPEAIHRQLALALDRAPLMLGSAAVPVTLAGGVLRALPIHVAGPTWTADTAVSVDLNAITMTLRTTLRQPGEPGAILVTEAAPFGGDTTRSVDATGLVGTLQAHAIARAQERIDVMEQDIRERAAFNRQLKAIQANQQAARDHAEAEKRNPPVRAEPQTGADPRAKAAARAASDDVAAEAAAAAQATSEARRAEAARQKTEDARLQSEVEAAARADAASKVQVEKQRLIDKALKSTDAPLDLGVRDAPLGRLRRPANRLRRSGTVPDPFNPPAPPSIIQERGAAPAILDPSAAGRY